MAKNRQAIEASGTQLAFVHPNPEAEAAAVARQYSLDEIGRFSDPQGKLYRAFGLGRAGIMQFFKLDVMRRYFEAWRAGHGCSRPTGDVLRMPGVFLLHQGAIVNAYRHRTPADQPDYLALALLPT